MWKTIFLNIFESVGWKAWVALATCQAQLLLLKAGGWLQVDWLCSFMPLLLSLVYAIALIVANLLWLAACRIFGGE